MSDKISEVNMYSSDNLAEKGLYFHTTDTQATIESPNVLKIQAPTINFSSGTQGSGQNTIIDVVSYILLIRQDVNNLMGI